MTEKTILLTLEQVREWQQERDRLVEEEAKLRERRALLDKLLEAAALFFDAARLPPHKEPSLSLIDQSEHDPDAASGISLIDAIQKVVTEAGVPLSNTQIKRKLAGTGFNVARLEESPNYFYTATKRLVQRGVMDKLPNGSYVARKNAEAPEGSFPAQGPSEASIERRIDRPAELQPSGPVKPEAGGGT